MSGCPIRPVRHIYRRIGSGPITNYSTIGGICKICPPVIPPPPPPPPGNIEFRVFSAVPYSVTFLLFGGTGTYDLGNGVLIPFSSSTIPVNISGVVPVGGTVKIYSDNLEVFSINNQPVSSLDVSNCPTLKELVCSQTTLGQSYITGAFDISANPNLTTIEFLNTPISSLTGVTSCPQLKNIGLSGAAFTQTTADQLVNDLLINEKYNGDLAITSQSTGTIDITDFNYFILENTYNWTIS
jgi:hypothetical protein